VGFSVVQTAAVADRGLALGNVADASGTADIASLLASAPHPAKARKHPY